jgi:hypothetical protein
MIKNTEIFSEVVRLLAAQIAEDVFEEGSEVGYPVTRIAFKARNDCTDDERELGGLCQSSLARCIQTAITRAVVKYIKQG